MGKIIMTYERALESVDLRASGKSWDEIGEVYGCTGGAASKACYRLGERSNMIKTILKNASDASSLALRQKNVNKRGKSLPLAVRPRYIDPETYDQKLTGTPPLCRSALNNVETDGRGNISKGDELGSPLGPIRIPDIRIASTVQAREVA